MVELRKPAIRFALLGLFSALLVPACGDPYPKFSFNPGYYLTASTASFSATQGGADPQDQIVRLISPTHFRLTQSGWTATSDQPWLTVSPPSGTIVPGRRVPITLAVHLPAPQVEGWIGATSTVGAPAPREDHDAAWTGSRMVLWGGEQNGTKLSTGGLYDPVLDQWTGATSMVGAPSVRTLHTLVWTGSEVIVWGGSTGTQPSPGSTYYGDGYRYNPATDAWLGTISTAGAPSPRSLHAAVWAGTWMIIWGGYDGAGLLNTGGIFDPATDTWIGSLSTVNAPTPRLHHVAVWTGTRMIVWGGQDATGDVNDGKSYDPTTDQWTPISSVGAPTPRQAATAIWTGQEMVVWGGSVLSGTRNAVNSGARYSPAMDAWVGATPTTGAPTARQSHSAVWTGTRMVVSHGASPAAGFFDTGGIYQPPISGVGTYTATVTVQPPAGPPLILPVTLTVAP